MSIPKSDPVWEGVRQTIAKHSMLAPGNTVVLAVSGGPDSVCLLSVLHELSRKIDLSLHVAHLDHSFRGDESAAEAAFVRNLASRFGVPAVIESFDVPAYCRERGLSAQAGAREVRYRFLNRIADVVGAHRIALGHTADDQAETLLMRLIRGAGVSGLAAIPPSRDRIIRPLIETTRKEIEAYLKQQGLDFVVDPSNLKPLYTRNRVRLEIIPLLERFNPSIITTLAAEAALLRDEDAAMDAAVNDLLPRLFVRNEDAVRIDRNGFLHQRPAFQRRLFRAAAARALEGDPAPLSAVQIEAALRFMAETQTGRAAELPFGLVLEREYETFVLRRAAAATKQTIPLSIPGSTIIPERTMELVARIHDDPAASVPEETIYLWQAVFDYDKIALPLNLRSRQDGDSFCPSGMGGKRKKLQDYFVDEKIPRPMRDAVPLLCAGADILWVMGLRTDERFLPGPDTKRKLTVQVRQIL